MRYMGSKNKIAKHLLPILERARGDRYWVEPFCGGCNLLDKVQGPRIANDSNKYLIALWQELQRGYVPPNIVTKEMYREIRLHKNEYPDYLVGFVGFLCSFGGKWFGGYAADSKGNNYAERGSRVMVKQSKKLKDVIFSCGRYENMLIPDNSLIYCDPPYAGTTKYKDAFDHVAFWKWCDEKVKEGHTVFVSEYNAPQDWKCVLEIEHKTILDKNSQYVRIEKLFTKEAKP